MLPTSPNPPLPLIPKNRVPHAPSTAPTPLPLAVEKSSLRARPCTSQKAAAPSIYPSHPHTLAVAATSFTGSGKTAKTNSRREAAGSLCPAKPMPAQVTPSPVLTPPTHPLYTKTPFRVRFHPYPKLSHIAHPSRPHYQSHHSRTVIIPIFLMDNSILLVPTPDYHSLDWPPHNPVCL